MNSLKNFLLHHGEKLALAVVAIICALTIAGKVGRDNRELELPNGKSAQVNQDEIKRKIEAVRQHLGSKVKVKADPAAEKTSILLARLVLAGSVRANMQATLQWYPYVQNPPVGAPPLFAKPPVIEGGKNIPEEYRTRFGNAERVRVYAAVDNITVVCRDSQYLNYPEPGSRKMLLWRKAIGSGRDSLNPADRVSMMRSPRSEMVSGTPAEKPAAKGKPTTSTDRLPPAMLVENTPQLASMSDAAGDADSKTDISAAAYRDAWEEADIRAEEDMKSVCTPASVVATGWELVTMTMYALKQEPTEEILRQIIESGVSPDLVEMSAEEEEAYKAKKSLEIKPDTKETKSKAPAVKQTDWDDLLKPRKPRKTAAAESEVAVSTTDAESQRYYVYVDRDIQQNMVYRYAVIATVQPRWPDKALLEKPEYQGWNLYCDVAGISGIPPTGGDFAIPARIIKDKFENAMPVKRVGVVGLHLDFTPCYQAAGSIETEPNTKTDDSAAKAPSDSGPVVRSKELRDDKGRLTPLGWAYKQQEQCYSDFVYTDLVLTPKEFDFEVLQAYGGANGQVTLRVHKVEKDGTPKSGTFMIPIKPLSNSPAWGDFLAKTANGSPVWPPKELSIQEVYGKLENIKPIAIGELRGKDNFTSGWGVVDLRPYQVTGKIMKLDPKTEEWKVISDYPPRTDTAVIIAEMTPPKGQPRRFLRIFRPATQPSAENRRHEYRYIWEPELEKRVKAREKSLENTPAPAASTEVK